MKLAANGIIIINQMWLCREGQGLIKRVLKSCDPRLGCIRGSKLLCRLSLNSKMTGSYHE